MKHYPQLKYPLDRRALEPEAGMILLAYDIVWRWHKKANISHLEPFEGVTLLHDTEANLSSLGAYVEQKLGKDRFDPKDVQMCEFLNSIEETNRRRRANNATE